jgi:hypothetical protein
VLVSLEHDINACIFWVDLATEPTGKFESNTESRYTAKETWIVKTCKYDIIVCIIMLRLVLYIFLLIWFWWQRILVAQAQQKCAWVSYSNNIPWN